MSAPLIVHTEASIGWGGQEIRVLTELKYMRARGYGTLLLAPEKSEIYKRTLAAGLPVQACKFDKWSRLADFFFLWRLFAKLKPVMVASHSSIDTWVGLMAAKAARVPMTIRYRHISAPTKKSPSSCFVYHRLADSVVTTGDCISLPLIKELSLPEGKVHTIPTGIAPPERLPEREEARIKLAKELSLPENSRFIGMVAVLRSWKGHRVLFKAFESLLEKFPKHHLVIVGDGPIAGLLQTEVASSERLAKRVFFTGHKTNVFDYFSAFDAAILCSLKNEGIPQSLLQAMWAKTPVVGTRVGGIPEIVKEGETGWLCEGDNASSLAEAMERALTEKVISDKFVENAYAMVRDRHTVEAMGESIEKLMASKLGAGVFPSPLPTR